MASRAGGEVCVCDITDAFELSQPPCCCSTGCSARR
ncbi:hypothetical protein [Nonomuraea sp. NPDC049504]